MDAYTASVNAFTRLADVVRSQVALQVASWLEPQVERSLRLVANRELPGSALLEKRDTVYQIHETACRLDPLSGDVLRPRILETANAIDRRFYTSVLQRLANALQEGNHAVEEDVQKALFWVSQNGLLEDLEEVAERLPRELPEQLEFLRHVILERRDALRRISRNVIAVREIMAPDPPVRFLVSTPGGRPLDPALMQSLRKRLMEWGTEEAMASQSVSSMGEADDQVLLLRSATAERLQETLEGVLLEPDAKFYLQGEAPRGRQLRLHLVDRSGAGLKGVPVTLALEDPTTGIRREHLTATRHDGCLVHPLGDKTVVSVEINPRGTYWSKRLKPGDEVIENEFEIVLDHFPEPNSELCWWRRLVRFSGQGRGVRIALIDSGVSHHTALQPMGGSCVKELGYEPWNQDDLGHGTHIAGILCGRDASRGFLGIAPEAELWVIRVCAGPKGEFHASHLIEAIRKAVEYDADIINISASTATHLITVEQELQDVVDRGILVVAAAGNQGRSEVCYPARFEDAVGVSACGQRGSYPLDSTHVKAESQHLEGDLYFAGFSNFGPGVDVCAPGVAIVSTVPDGLFGSMDGTSMACPMVAGAAACILSEHEELQRVRDRDRVLALKTKLFQNCRKMVNWTDLHQGAGLLHP